MSYIDRQSIVITEPYAEGWFVVEAPDRERAFVARAEGACQALEAFEADNESVTFLGYCPACGYDRDTGRTEDEDEADRLADLAAEDGPACDWDYESQPEFNGAFGII